MKAIQLRAHGGMEQLRYVDIPVPEYGPGEALVRVKATALNHRDIWVREGRHDIDIEFPLIPGIDVAGVVEAVGESVDPDWIGQDVMLHPNISCGVCDACISGRDDECPDYRSLGNSANGGYAEFIVVPAVNLIPMPKTLSYQEAASLPLVTLTAWHALVSVSGVHPGEDVLVQAGGSGVGVILVQIAKLFGARVIATAGSEEKLERLRALGADAGINYNKKDFLQEVMRLTDGKGVEVVCEQIGGEVFERSLEALGRGGRLVTYGATIGGNVRLDILLLMERRITVHFTKLGTKRDLLEAMPFIREGQIRPVVDRVFSLYEAAAAQQYMLDRRNFGKIVLAVDESKIE